MPFKRNQVEEAIIVTLQSERAPDELRTRVKRLLDTDRSLDQARAEAPHAFYTAAPPGRGAEVWFSDYEAFALLLGMFLLEHRWPQGTVVGLLRHVRPTLQPLHTTLLARAPAELFDQEEIVRRAAPGMHAVDSADPMFLAVVTSVGREADREDVPSAFAVCRGEEELMRFRRAKAPPGSSMTFLELSAPAHSLARSLDRTTPRSRGRPSH
jgi:hypothetical protein